MSSDLSFIHMFLQASWVVKMVMLVLLAASLVSWSMIYRKWRGMKQALKAANDFENRFWSGSDLTDLYDSLTARRKQEISGMAAIFEAGFKEFARQRQHTTDPKAMVESSERAMRVALSREMDELETHLSFLATTGSTSPYIGLFGTVWGIMNSFRALSNVNHATLNMVAPGISEALVATAMGLLAAIPAVIAYNRFSSDVERLLNRYDTFLDEFSTILARHAHRSVKQKAGSNEGVTI